MKKILLTVFGGLALICATANAQVTSFTQNYTASNTVTTTGVNFSFTKFNASLGTLTAVDLIFNSSVPGGYITLNRTSGSASFTRLDAGLLVSAGGDTIFETNPLINISATPASGNNTFTSTAKNFNVNPSQSLLSTTPFTWSIDSSLWSYFSGTGSANLLVILQADAITSTNTNVTKSYNNFTAPTSITTQYTYTSSAVPEPGQVAASLLLLGGIGAYVFIKRRKKSAPAAA